MQLKSDSLSFAGKFLLLLITNFSFVYTQNYNIYFGDFHSHTTNSDGTGTPSQAYKQAIEYGADFLAVTDHSWEDKIYWDSCRVTADKNTSDSFVAIAGFEMTKSWGHMCIFNTSWYTYSDSNIERDSFYSILAKDSQCIAQWNHPTEMTDEFDKFSGYSPELDKIINLLEIINDKRDEIFESSYIKALDKGWHVSPAANSDNHNGQWIKGYSRRTAVLATGLTRDEIYTAMKNHRTYATEDKNLQVHFFINGHMMGSVLHAPPQCIAQVYIHDPDTNDSYDRIKSVEIITEKGNVAASLSCMNHTVSWTQALDRPDSVNTYFYIRIKNLDGRIAFTAPVWIEAEERKKPPIKPVGIKKSLALYDISGRLIMKTLPEKTRFPENLSSGIYIIQHISNGRNNGGKYCTLLK